MIHVRLGGRVVGKTRFVVGTTATGGWFVVVTLGNFTAAVTEFGDHTPMKAGFPSPRVG